MVYGLGNKGVQLLEIHLGVSRPGVNWTAKNREANRIFLEPSLAVADVLIAAELSSRRQQSFRLIDLASFPKRTGANGCKVQWNVSIRRNGKAETLGVEPDAVFALECSNDPHRTALVFRRGRPVPRCP
jgi:hypothetical protein